MKIYAVGKSGKPSWIERTGEHSTKSEVNEEHCCGLQGYDPMLGDSCPACEIMQELYESLSNSNN